MTPAHGSRLQVCSAANGEWVLEAEQWLPSPLAQLFPFFANPYNLQTITPPFLHFDVLRCSSTEVCRGTLIDYRLRLRGLPIRWRTRIDTWDPPHCFVDLQLEGPYALWHHTHEFEERDGGTTVRDCVRYRLPLGVLGSFTAGRWVRRDVERIFRFRQGKMQELFAAAPPPARAVDGAIADGYLVPAAPHAASEP